jgi:hypothetical protein
MSLCAVLVFVAGSDLRLWDQMEGFGVSVRSEYLWQLFWSSLVRMGIGERFWG